MDEETIMRLLVLSLVVLTQSCASTPAFDQLPPIGTSGQSELRIQIAHYPLASRTAYVVRSGVIVAYHYTGSRWRTRTLRTSIAEQALEASTELAQYDGQNLSCGIVDGNAATIEAVIHGGRFSLRASNPDWCPDSGSQRVTEVMRMIESAID